MSSEVQTSYLVINALGADRTGLVSDISKVITESGCNIEESRMSVLGEEFAVILLAAGKWNAVAKLENSLEALEQRKDISVVCRRTNPRKPTSDLLPYAVDVVAMDQVGIVSHLASFFAQRGINIEEMATNRYSAAHTGTPMFAVHISVGIPAATHIAALRDEFLDFCDRLNLDSVIEPIKG
ncbi:MAG: glycine cleavage system protein R [Gammaproteobacteria bacterium]